MIIALYVIAGYVGGVWPVTGFICGLSMMNMMVCEEARAMRAFCLLRGIRPSRVTGVYTVQ